MESGQQQEISHRVEAKKPKTHMWIMRHAPTVWNKEPKRIQGTADTDIEQEEISAFFERIHAKEIPKPDLIVVSGLQRTIQTGTALKEYRQWEDVDIVSVPAFNERKWGILEGLTHKEARERLREDRDIIEKYPDLANPDVSTQDAMQPIWDDPTFKAPGGGESLKEKKREVDTAFRDLLKQYGNKKMLLVTHMGVLQTQQIEDKGVTNVSLSLNESGDSFIEKQVQ